MRPPSTCTDAPVMYAATSDRRNAAVRPKGVDKPDGELESLNNDLKRVEKRTTM